jgi:simple sugar transport system substrate-binding protein
MKVRFTTRAAIAALVALGLVPLAANAATKSATQAKKSPFAGMSVIVIGGPLVDPFFSALEKGGRDAANLYGAKYEYLAPKDFSNAAADLARLIQTATSKKPDVIVVGDFIPPAEDPEIKKAVAAGITVMIYNSGAQGWQDLGAKGFIGEDATAVGTAAGKAESAAGVKNGLCVNHVPENPVLQARCDGYIAALKAAGGSGETLTIPSSEGGDQQVVSQKIGAYLRTHSDIDGIFTLGTSIANSAVAAVATTGSKVKIGTADVSSQALSDVKNGKLLFVIDQQPYTQTYFSVVNGFFKKAYGLGPLNAMTTAPTLIAKNDVDFVLSVQDKYKVRGAS